MGGLFPAKFELCNSKWFLGKHFIPTKLVERRAHHHVNIIVWGLMSCMDNKERCAIPSEPNREIFATTMRWNLIPGAWQVSSQRELEFLGVEKGIWLFLLVMAGCERLLARESQWVSDRTDVFPYACFGRISRRFDYSAYVCRGSRGRPNLRYGCCSARREQETEMRCWVKSWSYGHMENHWGWSMSLVDEYDDNVGYKDEYAKPRKPKYSYLTLAPWAHHTILQLDVPSPRSEDLMGQAMELHRIWYQHSEDQLSSVPTGNASGSKMYLVRKGRRKEREKERKQERMGGKTKGGGDYNNLRNDDHHGGPTCFCGICEPGLL